MNEEGGLRQEQHTFLGRVGGCGIENGLRSMLIHTEICPDAYNRPFSE